MTVFKQIIILVLFSINNIGSVFCQTTIKSDTITYYYIFKKNIKSNTSYTQEYIVFNDGIKAQIEQYEESYRIPWLLHGLLCGASVQTEAVNWNSIDRFENYVSKSIFKRKTPKHKFSHSNTGLLIFEFTILAEFEIIECREGVESVLVTNILWFDEIDDTLNQKHLSILLNKYDLF